MIKLGSLLGIEVNDYTKYKIHFAFGDETNPLIAFQKNIFKEWQESQNKKNFEREFIISLIYYKNNKWLFAGVYKSNGCQRIGEKYFYDTELMNIQNDMIGRIIIDFTKGFRQSYPNGENYIDLLYVSEIFGKPLMIEDFPGYNKVNIEYEKLKLIVETEIDTWKSALSITKGIYLIVDQISGKQYVGSATGDKAFWSRWSEYIYNGHGGNIDLKRVIKEYGLEYAKDFKFSILETAGMSSSDETILQREAFWKDILLTRKFGYNKN